MKIDCRLLADELLNHLAGTVKILRSSDVIPALEVILIGNDPASLSYIRQKEKAANIIGAIVNLIHLSDGTLLDLSDAISSANLNPKIHGIIVQRPIPDKIGDSGEILHLITPEKDVDGFIPGSGYTPPVALAVVNILKNIQILEKNTNSLPQWLDGKKITIIGRGETAGRPIADYLQSLGCTTSQIHSKTTDPYAIISKSDVIVSCVGKPNVVSGENLKPGVILISVGIWRDRDGKLHGDYEPEDIENVASYYTPTPGGVGPVNVACLMENLIEAAKRSHIKPQAE